MTEATTQNSTAHPADLCVDPLVDAHCLKCGYSLRGLPENRCPECGTAFDPKEMTTAFVAKWPRLLMWYLIAIVARSLTELPRTINILSSLPGRLASETQLDAITIYVTFYLKEMVTLILGVLAIWGLYRRRDWARKACIAIFVVACLETLARLGPVPGRVAGPAFLEYLTDTLFRAVQVLSSGILPVLLIHFLLTGICPHSLIRGHSEQAPLLPLARFHPKQDWLLLTSRILMGIGVTEILWSTHLLYALMQGGGTRLRSAFSNDTGFLACIIAIYATMFAAALCAIVAAGWIRRRPETLRTMLAAVTIITAARTPLGILSMFVSRNRSGYPRFTSICQSILVDLKGPVLIPLILLLFALLAIKREDINRLARDDGPGEG